MKKFPVSLEIDNKKTDAEINYTVKVDYGQPVLDQFYVVADVNGTKRNITNKIEMDRKLTHDLQTRVLNRVFAI